MQYFSAYPSHTVLEKNTEYRIGLQGLRQMSGFCILYKNAYDLLINEVRAAVKYEAAYRKC